MARWRNFFSQLLNVHGVNNVRPTEIYTAEPLVPEPNTFEVELTIENLKSHKKPGTDQIPAELNKNQGLRQFAVRFINLLFLFGIRRICEIYKLIISIWNKEDLPGEWKVSIIIPIYKKGDKTDFNNYRGISFFSNYVQNFIHHPAVNVNSI